MPTSLADVAKVANLSKATISRVLAGRSCVSEEKRDRALKAIESLNYQPNRSAQSLRRRRNAAHPGLVYNTFVVAAISSSDSVDNFLRHNGAVYDGIMEAAHERDVQLLLKLIPAEQCRQPISPPCLSGLGYDALMVSPAPGVDCRSVALAGRVVWFGARPCGVEDPAVVEGDPQRGGEGVMRHLRETLGHRRICLFLDNDYHLPYLDRRDAFRAMAPGYGLEACQPAEFAGGERLAEFIEMFKRSTRRPTAIMVASDGVGARLVTALQQAGFNVPKDISVTGFDGRDKSRWCTPGLTTWEVDWHELGRSTLQQAMLMAERKHSTRVLIGGRLLEQGSTAKVCEV